MTTVGAILVGGTASRLGGVDKPLVEIAGRTILARALDAIAPLVDEVVLVARPETAARYRDRGARVIVDERDGAGPLAGLEAALRATGAERLLLVAGDMPCLHPAALALVLAVAPDAPAVAPLARGRLEPLHARYAGSLLPTVTARLDAGERSLVGLLAAIGVRTVDESALRVADPSLRTLANVNTPEELALLERAILERG